MMTRMIKVYDVTRMITEMMEINLSVPSRRNMDCRQGLSGIKMVEIPEVIRRLEQ